MSCSKLSTSDPESLVEYDGREARHWTDLLDHSEDLLRERREELELDYKQLTIALAEQTPDWESFVSICGKILTNCFCLRSDR